MVGVLRGLIREMLAEDAYTRRVDRVVTSKIRPPWTDLTVQAVENPTAAKANIENALKLAGGDFEEAAEYVKHPAGEKPPSGRTLRRKYYELTGGSRAAMRNVEEIRDDAEGEEGGE